MIINYRLPGIVGYWPQALLFTEECTVLVALFIISYISLAQYLDTSNVIVV